MRSRSERELSFGMLKATASFGLAGFLAFDHSRIARKETFFAEGGTEVRLHFNHGPGDAQLDGAGLAGDATAFDRYKQVERVGIAGVMKRGGGFGTSADMAAEIIHDGFVVDEKLSGALFNTDASHAFFAAAGGPNGE